MNDLVYLAYKAFTIHKVILYKDNSFTYFLYKSGLRRRFTQDPGEFQKFIRPLNNSSVDPPKKIELKK